MIKRLLVILGAICLVAGVALGAGTNTTNYKLYKPALHETNWGTLVNANWDSIDSNFYSATGSTLVTGKGYVDGNLGVEGVATASVLNLPNLSASQAVLTDANRNLTSQDYLNQAVKTTSSPTFAGATLTGAATASTLVTASQYVDGTLGVEGNATAQVLTVSGATTTNSISASTDATIGRDISFQVATGNILSLTALDLTNNIFSVTGSSLTTGSLAYLYSNSANTSARNLVSIVNDNTAATGATALNIQQDAAGTAFNCAMNANGTVLQANGTQNTSSDTVYIVSSYLTTASILNLQSNSADTSSRNLVNIVNDNALASNAVCLDLQQDAAHQGIYLHQNGNGTGIRVDHAATQPGAVELYCNSLTTGQVIVAYSNSADASTRTVVQIVNDNTAATAADALFIQQDSTAYAINTNSGARLTANGIWTNAPCSFDEKENVAQVEPTNTVDKLKALKLYKYQKKSEVYGMKQDVLSESDTIQAPDEYNDRYEEVKGEDGKPTGEKKLVSHELKSKEHRKKVDDNEYVLDKDVYKKVVGKEYPKDKKNPNAKYYTGYVLDDPSTPEELISRDWNGHIEGISPQDGVNFLLAVNKELVKKVEALEARVEALEKKNK